jgi:RNA polymerase sigma-70 factor (ECF subfamily)
MHAPNPESALRAQKAFPRIYRRFYGYVWRELARRGVPLSLVDDALQDVFVVVHRRLPQFEGRAKVQTWIYEITRRVSLDYHKRNRPLASESVTGIAIEGDTPAEVVERKQALALLQGWLDELDPDKRRAFILCELEQRSAPEIAQLLDVNINTVYARIRAARLHIHKQARRSETVQRVLGECRGGAGRRHERHAWVALMGRIQGPSGSIPLLAKLGTVVGAVAARPFAAVLITGVIALGGVAAADSIEHTSSATVGVVDRPSIAAVPPAAPLAGQMRAVASSAAEPGPPARANVDRSRARRSKSDPSATGPTASTEDVARAPSPQADARGSDPLRAQVIALDEAREAVRHQQWVRARGLLEQYERNYRDSPLAEDLLKLQLIVACHGKDTSEIERRQDALRRRFGAQAPDCAAQ